MHENVVIFQDSVGNHTITINSAFEINFWQNLTKYYQKIQAQKSSTGVVKRKLQKLPRSTEISYAERAHRIIQCFTIVQKFLLNYNLMTNLFLYYPSLLSHFNKSYFNSKSSKNSTFLIYFRNDFHSSSDFLSQNPSQLGIVDSHGPLEPDNML